MEYIALDLQLFADGGAGAAGGDGGAAAGAGDAAGVTAPDAGVPRAKKRRENPLAAVKYGKQPEPIAPSPDATGAAEAANTTGDAGDAGKKPSFQELIEGEYKAEFGEYVQNVIRQRFKANAENEEKLGKMTPIMEMLGQKYDIDPNDIDRIAKVVGDDDSLYLKNQLSLAHKHLYVVKGSPALLRLHHLINEMADTIYIEEVEQYGPEQLLAMVAGKDIDYAVCDEGIARHLLPDFPELDISTDISFTQFYAWGTSRHAPALRDSLNAWLDSCTATPAYRQLIRNYFKKGKP